MLIRPATIDDIKGIKTMQSQSWVDTYANEKAGVSFEWVNDFVSKWTTDEGIKRSKEKYQKIFSNSEYLFSVATEGSIVLAMLFASKINSNQQIEALYVDKKYHGTGLATDLMNDALNWFDKSIPIYLEVVSYNKRAIAFYLKYGFEIQEGSEHEFVDKMPAIKMIRKGIKK